jgi:hypothetical protein
MFFTIGLFVGLVIGWFVAVYRMSIDTQLVRLESDQLICKKPPEGHILMAVTVDVARKLLNKKNMTQNEMRSLLWNQNE